MKKIFVIVFGVILGLKISAQDILSAKLVMASIRGELSKVQELVEQGADVNAQDEYGNVPLVRASVACHFPVVKYLVAQGADVNSLDLNYYDFLTPVVASDRCGLDQIKFLVDNGADINAVVFDSQGIFAKTIFLQMLDDICSGRHYRKRSCLEDLEVLEYVLKTVDFSLIQQRLSRPKAMLLKYLESMPKMETWEYKIAFEGDLDAVKSLFGNNIILISEIHNLLNAAFYGGNEDIMLYLLEQLKRHPDIS